MTEASEPTFAPRLNHVAISVDPALLDERGRPEMVAFFAAVFGWAEGDNTGESGNPLILYTGAPGEFLYLLPADPPLVAPRLDHFGLQVSTRDALEQIVERAKTYGARDDGVQIVDVETRTTRGSTHDYTLTNAYIRYRLPLMIELQHLVRHEHPREDAARA